MKNLYISTRLLYTHHFCVRCKLAQASPEWDGMSSKALLSQNRCSPRTQNTADVCAASSRRLLQAHSLRIPKCCGTSAGILLPQGCPSCHQCCLLPCTRGCHHRSSNSDSTKCAQSTEGWGRQPSQNRYSP